MFYTVYDLDTRRISTVPSVYGAIQVGVPSSRKMIAVLTTKELINQMQSVGVVPEFSFGNVTDPSLKKDLELYFKTKTEEGEPDLIAVDYLA